MKERKRAGRLSKKRKGKKNEASMNENTESKGMMIIGKASAFLRSHDIFGQFVTISYQGNQTYTTSFGGFLSVLFKLFMLIYLFTQVKTMIEKSDW